MAEERLEEYRKIVQKILEAFHGVPFPIIVESTTNTKAEIIDLSNEKDKTLVKELSELADLVAIKYNKTNIDKYSYQRIKGKLPKNFRPNEVSIILEHKLPQIFSLNRSKFKVIREIRHFTQTGYPDEKVVDIYGRVTFVEIKATTRPDEGSPRDFYFTPLENTKSKVNVNGRHLLLGFIIKEVQPKVFRTVGWKLVDLTKIKVSMKPEFNADNREIYKKEAIIAENWIGENDGKSET